jgi:AcrR family transcriptional regulator
MTDVTDRPMRADARRNRERVLAAAEATFSELGVAASVEEVARRAGVGVGTVCRHFETKQALVEAVLSGMYEALLAQVERALDEPDPGDAFRAFFLALAEVQGRHRVLAEQMAAVIDVAATAAPRREALYSAMTELVVRAQGAGTIRDDIGAADVTMLVAGVAHATAMLGDAQPVLRERYVAIVLDGLRPVDRSALPGRALDFAEIARLKQRAGH